MLKIKNIEKLVGTKLNGITKDFDCSIKSVDMSINILNNNTPTYIIYFECDKRSYGIDLILELDRKKSTMGVYEMKNNITKDRYYWHSSDFDNISVFSYKLKLFIEKISKEIFMEQIPF